MSAKGGCVAPIMVPATPGRELCKIIREVAEKEAAEGGIKFKVVVKAGEKHKRNGPKSESYCHCWLNPIIQD